MTIHARARRHITTTLSILTLAWCMTWPGTASAVFLPEIGDEALVGFDATGSLLFKNLGFAGAEFDAVLEDGPVPGPNETVEKGFVILDRSLLVTTNLEPGKLRARYRLRYDGRALRRLGVRERALRLMRFSPAEGRWLRARRLIRAARADIRFLPGRRADFVLGHFGVDPKSMLVWGVTDVAGRYAIGARLPVVEPAAAVLLATGLGLLGLVGLVGLGRRGVEPSG